MVARVNPALTAFLAALPESLAFAQVLITRQATSFELRHINDRGVAESSLELLSCADLRELANYTKAGAFRPLKSAPNLRSGWRVCLATPDELEQALEHLYPGALADWFALREGKATPMAYRDFVGRQTGMYRITQMLDDAQMADMAKAACDGRFCLKQRLWHGPALPADASSEKSVIPCLEPCPILLEFARKSMRLEQEDKTAASLSAGDLQTLHAALTLALTATDANQREADFNDPANPRRLLRTKLLVERWLAQVPRKEEKE